MRSLLILDEFIRDEISQLKRISRSLNNFLNIPGTINWRKIIAVYIMRYNYKVTMKYHNWNESRIYCTIFKTFLIGKKKSTLR